MGIDLPLIWAVIILFGIMMYVVMDGFDLGIGILFPFFGSKNDRDVMMNTVAPVWDGNETWLVLGGAGLLAAFPLAYSVILSALALPLILMLIGLIFRGVAFEFRFKAHDHERGLWDAAFAGGSSSKSSFATVSFLASRGSFQGAHASGAFTDEKDLLFGTPAPAPRGQAIDELSELLGVLELTVDRGEAHIGDLVDEAQALHHHLADLGRGDLLLLAAIEQTLYLIYQAGDLVLGNRALLARDLDGAAQLIPTKRLTAPIGGLDHHQAHLFDLFEGRETPVAGVALAPPLDGRAVAHGPGVENVVFILCAAIRASHLRLQVPRAPPPLLPSPLRRDIARSLHLVQRQDCTPHILCRQAVWEENAPPFLRPPSDLKAPDRAPGLPLQSPDFAGLRPV